MKSIRYEINNVAPILITDNTGDFNMVSTKDYISGNSILGAFAKNYINLVLKKKGIKPHDDPNFFSWFLSGQVVYANAYKVEINKYATNSSFPIPFSIQRMKKNEKEIKDLLLTQTPEQTKSIGGYGFFNKEDDNQDYITKVEIKKSFSPHQEYNPLTRTTKESIFFNYESIMPHQTFEGFIIGEETVLNSFISGFNDVEELFIGKSRNTQYGKVNFKFVSEPTDFVSELTNYSFNTINDKISLTFLSDVIIYNDNGFSSSLFEDLEKYLKTKIAGLQSIKKVFVRTGVIENYVSVWNLRKPSETCFLAGCSFLIGLEKKDKDELKKVQSEGIGERKNEGFGRIVFGLQNISDYKTKDKSKIYQVEKPKDDIPSNVKEKAIYILKNHLKMVISTQALEKVNSIEKYNITSSQIGRLESFIKSSDTKEVFRAKIIRLRDTAKDKLNNFRFGNEKFLDHLNNFEIADDIFQNEFVKKSTGDLAINLVHDSVFKNELYRTYFLTLFPSIRKAIKREK